MHPRRTHLWNHLVLGTLVLLVTVAAFCTVASAAEESRTATPPGASASP
jgi:hypothetical protein